MPVILIWYANLEACIDKVFFLLDEGDSRQVGDTLVRELFQARARLPQPNQAGEIYGMTT